MITLKVLKWSNVFSYGKYNIIDFTDNKVTQLLGKNGSGKSSLAWILEEVLFNKNSKGRKKESILNWYTDDKSYDIELSFSVHTAEYVVYVKRASTQQVKLIKDGVDISSHTATNTFKQIEEILGYNQKTFSQIVCQSHTSSLEFLTSPDTARKKFLIDLIGLNKYLDIGAIFKDLNSELTKELTFISGKLASVNSWIFKYKSQDNAVVRLLEVPTVDTDSISAVSVLEGKIQNIGALNKGTANNLAYKQALDAIQVVSVPEKPSTNMETLTTAKAVYNKTISDAKAVKDRVSKLGSSCPMCTQEIPTELKASMLDAQDLLIANNSNLVRSQDKLIKELQTKIAEWKAAKSSADEWEKYHMLYDPTMATELLDINELSAELQKTKKEISIVQAEIKRITDENRNIEEHNTTVRSNLLQLGAMTKDASELSIKVSDLQSRIGILTVLVKAFSTTGLAAYKLENITLELEELTNNYLVGLSDGRFQISFKLSGNDKLNVIISNNGNEADISTLSAGETTRVNISVLLAIRRLMQNLNGNSINLLFLDEAISTLDPAGKEKLVEVLLEEEHLNAILVSHEFHHPLLSRLSVAKTNNISTLIKE